MSIRNSKYVTLECTLCGHKSTFGIPHGHYLKIKKSVDKEINSQVEILKERPGREDVVMQEVVCVECGCCNGLNIISDVKNII